MERIGRPSFSRGQEAELWERWKDGQSASTMPCWWRSRASVMLDTIGFSGFNTAIQAVECGLPVVTREGRFLRARIEESRHVLFDDLAPIRALEEFLTDTCPTRAGRAP